MAKKVKTHNEQFMHIRMEYDDAMNLKREILYSELHFVKILQRIQQFRMLRMGEFTVKQELEEKLREIKQDFLYLEKQLPKLDVEEEKIPVKKVPRVSSKPKVAKKKSAYDSSLEMQLEEIKTKLNSLEL